MDIALFSQTNPTLSKNLLRLYGELEDLFGYEVDLVIIERDTDPVLRLEIFQHGKPLYESQPGLFVEQRVLAVKIFDDTEPLRQWRRRVLAQRILNLFARIKEDMPTTLKTTFLRAGELQILPADLAQRLGDAAAMRNILVHAYAKVDLKIVYDSISPALKDFTQFAEIMSEKMNLIQQNPLEQPPEEV